MGGHPVATKHIDIGVDFAKYLGARYRADGKSSGQEFREDLLEPAFEANDLIVIGLDGIGGYSASFMEEAFGGLVRKYGLDAVNSKIRFDAVERAYLVPIVQQWMRDAADVSGPKR
jgi:hypothetical protein